VIYRKIHFSVGEQRPASPVWRFSITIEDQNERLRSRIAINRAYRAMYREFRSTQMQRSISDTELAHGTYG
jgi:hypothetical protein